MVPSRQLSIHGNVFGGGMPFQPTRVRKATLESGNLPSSSCMHYYFAISAGIWTYSVQPVSKNHDINVLIPRKHFNAVRSIQIVIPRILRKWIPNHPRNTTDQNRSIPIFFLVTSDFTGCFTVPPMLWLQQMSDSVYKSKGDLGKRCVTDHNSPCNLETDDGTVVIRSSDVLRGRRAARVIYRFRCSKKITELIE